jgi:FkbM family methyltransferase
MARRGPLKTQTLAVLKERGIPVATVLDVGVMSGTPELVKAFPKVRHVLFEPVEEFAGQIARAYRSVDHELVQAAVAQSGGEVELRVHRKIAGMDISHSSMVETPADGEDTRTVPRISLDGFLKGRDLAEPFLLKIDIDGQELKVLKGAEQTLRRCSVVIVECAGDSLPARINTVQKAGFRLFDLSEPCYYDGAFWQCDAVFVRKDLHDAAFKRIDGGTVDSQLYQIFRG